jgi:threonine dehydrogenase-like Zn-dependent dehydrogenase
VRGLWLEDRRLRVRDDLPVPAPPPGEALIRVSLAGVCHTDVELTRGYYLYAGVLGHEFVGVVVRSPGHESWEGRRVVGEINATCGTCATCLAGRPTHCERRTVLGIVNRDGAFAEYLALPVRNLHAVPDGVADEVAVFAEPVAAAFEVLAQVPVRAADRVVVFGDGKLGQLVAQVLATTGCALTVVGRHARKLAHLSARGIATTLEPVAARSADVAVECSGRPQGIRDALAALRPRGTLVLKSTYAGEAALNLSAVVVDEIAIVGSRCGPFAPAIDALASGAVDVAPLVEARCALADGVEAIARASSPGTLKVLLAP